MDASLYPNIDHQEGISAFRSALDTRHNKLFPSSVLCDLFMDSPMSVNFANLFIGQFETNMLNDYKSKYNKLPGIWLRYIDDVFSLGIMTKPD